MKKAFLTIIGLLVVLFPELLFSQTSVYHPFPESNAAWSVYFGGWEPPACYDRYYFLNGDTVISTLTYHKINYFGWTGLPDMQTHECSNWHYSSIPEYLGAIRQDTTLKKVYFILPWHVTDTLLYDFNLSVGDTLSGSINCAPHTTFVGSIDSVIIGNDYRKRFNVTSNNGFGSIIEGIGSLTGLIEGLITFEWGGLLSCFSQNNHQLFPDTVVICGLALAVPLVDKNEFTLQIFPNPTSNIVYFNPVIKDFRLYDIFGQLLFSDKNVQKIDLTSSSKGIYIAHMDNRIVKIIKQ